MSKQNLIDQLQSRIDGNLSAMSDGDLMLLSVNSNAYLADLDVTALQTEVDSRLATLDTGSDYEDLTIANNQLRGLSQRFAGPELGEMVLLGTSNAAYIDVDGRRYLRSGIVETDVDSYPNAPRGFGIQVDGSYDLDVTVAAGDWAGICGDDDVGNTGDLYYYTFNEDENDVYVLNDDFTLNRTVTWSGTGDCYGMCKFGTTLYTLDGWNIRGNNINTGATVTTIYTRDQGSIHRGVTRMYDDYPALSSAVFLVAQADSATIQSLKRYSGGAYESGMDIDLSEILGDESITGLAGDRYAGILYVATSTQVLKLDHNYELVGVSPIPVSGSFGIDVRNNNLLRMDTSEVVELFDADEYVGCATRKEPYDTFIPYYMRIK